MSTRPDRETAYRVFAAEFDDATLSYAESDEERAPNYVVTPTGARVNRLFAVGVLTEIEAVNDTQLRARIVDPTGAFVIYAGQYQPEALSFLEGSTPPEFVAVTGKARTFQPEDSDRVFTSVRPETLSEVDAATRDRFTVDTAERTAERVATMREALTRAERGDELRAVLENMDVEVGLAVGIPRAIAHYGTTTAYLDAVEEMALDAARVVAGEREEVGPLGVAPGSGGSESDSPDRTATADDDETGGSEPTTPTTSSGSASETEPESDRGPESEANMADDGVSIADETEPTGEDELSTETESAVETAASGGESMSGSATETEPEKSVDTADEIDGHGEEIEPEADDDESDSATETETVDLDDPEAFELTEDEREHVEDEYGTEFETAGEVDGPGKADIEVPSPEDGPDASAQPTDSSDPRTDETVGTDAATRTDSEPTGDEAGVDGNVNGAGEPDDDGDTDLDVHTEVDETDGSLTDEANEPADDDLDAEAGSPAEEIDPEEAVVTVMRELDDGDGAEREAVVERVVDEYGLTPDVADDGIQSALMSGECYEPDDDTLKPI